VALQRCEGHQFLDIASAAKQVGLLDNRRPNSGASRTDEELLVSSLRTMLQGEEITASTHRGRVRQGAEAQVPVLRAPEQVQGQHNEARHTCTSAFTVPVS